ncbi:hypothetical protein SAZ10_31175 [Mesorhizobium sp. BAC0120]|uniref:hypothetical protein n=1 Tax=Mesorhizobium sp. BAC0120 TaxID=3090670 RepID=UPI00298C319D|nr:hypothetical protein [Mesorhizobium sp. BAC0120]MDW6026230.1 hypothetical protein [Mesorhizobium sp. BAC0120]
MNTESSWTVDSIEDHISVTDPEGETRAVELEELGGVMIETNDSGPFDADVWWLLFGADGRLACAFPQGAVGEKEAVALLSALPGFDHEAMVMAMGSTTNAVFPVWRLDPTA